jgi:dihydrofolate reductase
MDLFTSLDGYVPSDATSENPMGTGWRQLTAAWTSTRTFRRNLGDSSGSGTTGIDDRYAAAFVEGIGAEIMGAGMFGFHAFPDDDNWKGWWGERPPFGTPVYVLTHRAPRPSIVMDGGTTFHFRDGTVEDVLDEARQAAGDRDVRIGGGYRTARDFLQAKLVDDLHLMVAPVFLGQGHRLWDDLAGFDTSYTISTEVAESGEIHVTLTR